MNKPLENQSALISASSSGIGFHIASALADAGATVIVNGRSERSVSAALDALGDRPTPGRLLPLVADLSTAEGADRASEAYPQVDILVNNLGIYEPSDFFETSDQQWRSLFETNIMSAVRLTRHYMRRMLEDDRGRVLFVSSETALNPDPIMIHYSATKTMMLSIARGLAELTRGGKVTVNSVVPGPTRSPGVTDYIQKLYPDLDFDSAQRRFMAEIRPTSLIGRLAEPEEVAALVGFLASPAASAINGAAVRVEGGSVRSIL